VNKEFKTDVSPCAVTADELALINKLTVKELTAEEVYTFNVILCDNEIDRDCERFDYAALEKMAELFVGVTGIFDHNPRSENQSARIFSAKCETVDGRINSYGEPYVCLKAKAYIPRTSKNADLIADIDAGIKKEVSVSCAAAGYTCSICGSDMKYNNCSHIRGEIYDGKTCCGILSDITDAYEWSFVAIPAQVGAGVTKSYIKEFSDMESCIKSIKSGSAVKLSEQQSKQLAEYIETLEKQADDGKIYRSQLTGDAVKFAAIAIPSLAAKSVEKMCAGVETEELIKVRDAFRKKAGDIIPLTPQLKSNNKVHVTDNSDYKF
jgi:hypothetical protein